MLWTKSEQKGYPKIIERKAMIDSKQWRAEHHLDAYGISDDTWFTVGGMTILWNLFEQAHCNTRGDVPAIEAAIPIDFEVPLSPALASSLSYWKTRYVEQGQINHLFEGLRFRYRDKKEHVQSVLLDELKTSRAQLLAMLIIVFRLRNNLFHGTKGLMTLNDQRENIATACRVLSEAMLVLSSYA